MKKYDVFVGSTIRINYGSSFEIKAESEEEAILLAEDRAYDEDLRRLHRDFNTDVEDTWNSVTEIKD